MMTKKRNGKEVDRPIVTAMPVCSMSKIYRGPTRKFNVHIIPLLFR